ncbi:phosphatase PAP2 family protein [Halovivax gelatinilyticus]|uniref:phosphatase PAP2 family protein n=1 Tax=Halovivax gelatinilyticus TaxID=2961597 RepID=UPI0020CA94B5|nr:phosphatase PAP2 family protein [Halovivax gelatinilyticus]
MTQTVMAYDVLFDESTNEAIREAIPTVLVPLIERSTHLGDGATVAAIAVVMYWFSAERRRTRIFVLAVGLGALGLSTMLKGVIGRERPDPNVLAFAPEAYGGFSFPSAHALGSAAIFTMLVLTLSVGERWQRALVAAGLVGTVMLSRVVVGVHYLGDVIVGATIGVAFVLVAFRGYPHVSPERAFAAAFGLGLLGLVLGAREHSILVAGSSLGAGVTWYAVRDQDARPTGAAILALGVLTLPALFVIRAVEYVVGFGAAVGYNMVTVALGYAVVTAGVVLVPFTAERLNDRAPVVWLQSRLPFRGRQFDPTELEVPGSDIRTDD